MLLENLSIGTRFTGNEIGVIAQLTDLCGGYAIVKILSGSGAGTTTTYAPATEVRIVRDDTPNTEPKKETPMAATATKTEGKKTSTKAATNGKAESNGHAKKEGLRKAQILILQVLSKAKEPLSKAKIAELAKTDPTKMGVFIGPREGESEKTSQTWPFPGLYELGAVKLSVPQEEGTRGVLCSITAKGRQLLEKSQK